MYQTDPPLPAKECLPTMYSLKSEDPKEPGCSSEFHDFQPQLLRDTFRPPTYPIDRVFVASDMNLYYDVHHPLWYKRPDWFAVVGNSRFYEGRDLRLSYVIWQEGVNPFVIVELLSPGTENEDLGQTLRIVDQPPTKWQVYEQILRVPYYIVFDRYTDKLRAFTIQPSNYTELDLEEEPRIWMPNLELGLGLWQGAYQGIERLWLRWYDANGNWIPTPEEEQNIRAEQERQRGVDGTNSKTQSQNMLYQQCFRSLDSNSLRSISIGVSFKYAQRTWCNFGGINRRNRCKSTSTDSDVFTY